MSLAHAANPGRHSLAARKDDLYETPHVAVHALMGIELCRQVSFCNSPGNERALRVPGSATE